MGQSQSTCGSRAALQLEDPQDGAAHCIYSARLDTSLKLVNGKEKRSFENIVQQYGKQYMLNIQEC